MSRIFIYPLCISLFFSCKTQKTKIEQSQRKTTILQKDSLFQEDYQEKNTVFTFDFSQDFALEVSNQPDSLGVFSPVIVERIRKPNTEKIAISGGQIYLKLTHQSQQHIQQATSENTQKQATTTSEIHNELEQKQHKNQSKQTDFLSLRWLGLGALIILILSLWIAWRYHLFRRFKTFLNPF